MRIEKKQDEVLAKRKGLTGRTIVQIVWLLISFAAAYFIVNYLLDEAVISYQQIYNEFSLPNSVPQEAVLFGLMLVIVFFMQMVMIIGFMMADPEGRRKLGEPTLKSRNKDPFSDKY